MKVNKVKVLAKLPSKLRVAAYARVSTEKDSMLHSLASQISYYKALIEKNPQWVFSGIYADEAISGTKNNRPQFQEMVKTCKEGKIDMIITKSISRFARNTVTLLQTCRELKNLGVDVFFEEQRLHSKSNEGELILTMLATYAQEEAKTVSDNVLWRVKNRFEAGKVYSMTILGYRIDDGVLVVVPEEAAIVKKIFSLYLSGLGLTSISKKLNAKGYKTRYGNKFQPSTLFSILRNITYTGDLILQKTYRKDFMTKISIDNNGERPKYMVEEAHEPIISKQIFDLVQEEIARRQAQSPNSFKREKHIFTGKIVCEHCGRHYTKTKCRDKIFWRCNLYERFGPSACPSQKIPETELFKCTCEIFGCDEFNESLVDQIDFIEAKDNQLLIYHLKDGSVKEIRWEVYSRKNSWTPEMRKNMSIKIKEITKGHEYGKGYSNSSESKHIYESCI